MAPSQSKSTVSYASKSIVTYDEQQCFRIEIDDTVFYARIPNDAPGVYVIVHSQGELHGNGLCKSGKDYPCLPILDYQADTFWHNLGTMWDRFPAVMVRIPIGFNQRKNITDAFKKDLLPMKGSIGPCKRIGLMTGGGLPHGGFAMALKGVPGVTEVIDEIYRLDGRYVEGARYQHTRQAVLLTKKERRKKKGARSKLKNHRDNNIFKECPELYHIQAQIVLSPPATCSYIRTGVLTSRVPMTDSVRRSFAMVPGCFPERI